MQHLVWWLPAVGLQQAGSDYDLSSCTGHTTTRLRTHTVSLSEPARIDATLLHFEEWANRLKMHNPTWLTFL